MYIAADILIDGTIALEVPGEDTKMEGRIKYEGYEEWSEWISSEDPVSICEDNILSYIIIFF